MRITITLEEAVEAVRSHFGFPTWADIKIAGAVIPPLESVIVAVGKQYFHDDGKMNPSQKISLIKRIREMLPECGLADAKFASETWDSLVDSYKKMGIMAYEICPDPVLKKLVDSLKN